MRKVPSRVHKFSEFTCFFQSQNTDSKKEAEIYAHIKDSMSHHDAQTLDVAKDEQVEAMSKTEMYREMEPEPMEVEEDISMPQNDDEKVGGY